MDTFVEPEAEHIIVDDEEEQLKVAKDIPIEDEEKHDELKQPAPDCFNILEEEKLPEVPVMLEPVRHEIPCFRCDGSKMNKTGDRPCK